MGGEMSPTDKLPVTLEAQAWETVMRVLSEAPYRVVAPLIGEIQRQCVASGDARAHHQYPPKAAE
jgi:hypothetical protein